MTRRRWMILAVLASAAMIAPAPWHLPPALQAWAQVFLAIVLQALPFLLLGVFAAALVEQYRPHRQLHFGRRPWLAIPAASTLGAAFPVCECASVPLAAALQRRGLPQAAAFALMLASPAINPVVLASTAIAFGGDMRMMVARFVAGWLIACLVGWMWQSARLQIPPIQRQHGGSHVRELDRGLGSRLGGEFSSNHDSDGNSNVFPCDCAGPSEGHWAMQLAISMGNHLVVSGGYLAVGAGIAAFFKLVFASSLSQHLGQQVLIACLLMAVLAVIMSLCSEADAFVAAAFAGVSPTALLVFLSVGPVVDLKLMAMQRGQWGAGVLWRLAPITLIIAVLVAIAVGSVAFQDI